MDVSTVISVVKAMVHSLTLDWRYHKFSKLSTVESGMKGSNGNVFHGCIETSPLLAQLRVDT